jgi:hypothetical protein
MYCTSSAFWLWDFNAYVYNQTPCPNGVSVENYADLEGELAAYNTDTFVSTWNYVTGATIMESDEPGGIWCGEYWNIGPESPWHLEFSYENCTTPGYPTGGCNQPPNPGGSCAAGFINSGGICTRSTQFINNCDLFGGYDEWACGCTGTCELGGSCSPIVVDVLGDGFSLTNAANGVDFDVDTNGVPERRGWTSNGSDDAWLSLDRDGDNLITSGKELFGNITPQEPPSGNEEMNGFRALALYDQEGYGGNGDGKITRLDGVFNRLRLWRDANHNGISESCEMFALPDLGLRRIDLDYIESQRVDAHGNQFKYRSRVRDANGAQLGRWAWDVFLVVQQP